MLETTRHSRIIFVWIKVWKIIQIESTWWIENNKNLNIDIIKECFSMEISFELILGKIPQKNINSMTIVVFIWFQRPSSFQT